MGKIIQVNENNLLSDEHFVRTERGWLKAKELKSGDKIVGAKDVYTIKNIVLCGKRPDAPVIGETEK